MEKVNFWVAAITMLGAASGAQASVRNLAGPWNAVGITYGLDGTIQGEYGVKLDDTLRADGSVVSEVTVSILGESDLHFEYLFQDTAQGYSMVSVDGTAGGSLCFEAGLCEGYIGDAQGNGTATTIIVDDANSFRAVKTQLKDFRAVSLSYEKYQRVSAVK